MNVYVRKNTSYYHPIIYVLKVIEKNYSNTVAKGRMSENDFKKKIKKGEINFNKLICTQSIMVK